MPTYQFEAMDASGQEIKDVIDATSEEEAQATIRQMGYFVTKISAKKGKKAAAAAGGAAKSKKGRGMVLGGVKSADLTAFTRQLSILQDAGLPILRSLKILEAQCKPGRLKNGLLDVCEEIEGGATLSEAMAKSPKVFNRLFVNMIKAGEAGGALETILQRLADFQERAEALKRQVKSALIYPVVVVLVAVGILTFIMLKIVPSFVQIFNDFDTALPPATQLLMTVSDLVVRFWYLIPIVPIAVILFIKLLMKFKSGKMGWDMFSLRIPIFGQLVEKNILARTTRTLGTLVTSGVPILEALTITRETAGNAMFERMFGKVSEAIREGETIAKPMKENSSPGFHPVAMALWFMLGFCPFIPLLIMAPDLMGLLGPMALAAGGCGCAFYYLKMNKRVVNDLVVNMIDVGEETGELDTMLYKVSDTFDDEVKVLTAGLTKLMEPLLIIFLGFTVGFIVIALFMPLVSLIQNLSS